MQFNDVNDDMALPIKRFKVVACMAVYGRLPLLKHTIERLYQKNGCYKVICAGDRPEDKELCESLGAVWIHSRNNPLGHKWNRSFQAAKSFDPDACIYVGSSDWLSDNWIPTMQPYLSNHPMVGVAGMNLVDVTYKLRAVTWKGYNKTIRHETIGIGRMLSRSLLSHLHWQPFHDDKHNSLDRSMKDRAKLVGVEDYFVIDNTLKALSLSTPKWSSVEQNKHKFEEHWNDLSSGLNTRIANPEQWCNDNFPEVLEFHKAINPVTV